MNLYFSALKKYAVFSGRATRTEYWTFTLVTGAINLILCGASVLEMLALSPAANLLTILFMVYEFSMFIPSFAVTVRRLHDTGRSGWWMFLGLIPLIGGIVIFIFLVEDSQVGTNRYGPYPKPPAEE